MSFILASVMSSIILQVNEMVDGIIVGNMISYDAISAIGFAQPLTSAVLFLPAIIYHGTTYIAAKYIGAQDYHRAGQLFTMCLALSPLTALIAIAPLLLYTEQVIGFFTSDGQITPLLSKYLPWVLGSCVVLSFQTSITEFMKVIGKPKIAFVVFAIQALLNICLDLLLVRPYGISGAGMATFASFLLSGGIVLPFVRRNSIIRLESVNLHVCIAELPKCIELGATASMLMLLFAFQNIILNYIFLDTIGTNAIFVIGVFNQIMMVAYIVVVGAVDSVYQIGGSLWGEDDVTGYRMLFRIMMNLVAGGLALLTVAVVFFPTQIAKMFGADIQLAEWSRMPLSLMAMQLVPFGMTYLLTVNFNVVNFKKITVMVISIMPVLILSSVYVSSIIKPDAIWGVYTLAQWFLLGITLCSALYVSSRSKESLNSFTLIPRQDPIPSFSASFLCTDKNIDEVTRQVEDFLDRHSFPQPHDFSQLAADIVRHISTYTVHSIDFRVAIRPCTEHSSLLSLSVKLKHNRKVILPSLPPNVSCDIKGMNDISHIHISYEY